MTGRSTVRAIDGCPGRSGFKTIRKLSFCSLLLCAIVLPGYNCARAGETVDLSGWTEVEGATLPDHWQPLKFPSISGTTSYKVVLDPSYGPVIRAQSSAGAGGIARSIAVDPRRYQILNWSWKIDNTLSGSSLLHPNGDDFPARLMISFKTESSARTAQRDNILCYVWATDESIGTIAVNPIHSHIRTVVAASGSDQRGTWLEMSRNIVDDYQQAFSKEPGAITGVALMTDTDNTESQALAWYGPVWLSTEKEKTPAAVGQ